MAVTKRTRYEVLRRDDHACRYCGAMAPDVKLTIDHVLPVALGGTDDPGNLVTACRDCNAGKSSSAPDSTLVADVEADALRWAAAVKKAAAIVAEQQAQEIDRSRWFLDEWRRWDDDLAFLPSDWRRSVDAWLDSGLSPESLIDALEIAMGNRSVSHRGVFAYMGGIARKRIEKIHATAREILESEAD